MCAKKRKAGDNSQPEIIVIRRQILFDINFRQDLQWWYRQDPQKANKILDLVEVICADPFTGIGKAEPLKYVDGNTWSRRIDREHRLIYRVQEELIEFLQARYHYEK